MTARCAPNLRTTSYKRLGILGGTFDPVHVGHLTLAKLALVQARLDCLILMPCHLPPHRQAAHASAEDRLAMVELAVADQPGLQVSDFELDKSSTSYTVETLAHFRTEMPEADLFFCLGEDSLKQLKSWHQWQAILDQANLIVLERNSGDVSLDQDIHERIVDTVGQVNRHAGQILKLDAPSLDVSATELRQHLLHTDGGQEADVYLQQWLHPNVLKYIKEHQVYA